MPCFQLVFNLWSRQLSWLVVASCAWFPFLVARAMAETVNWVMARGWSSSFFVTLLPFWITPFCSGWGRIRGITWHWIAALGTFTAARTVSYGWVSPEELELNWNEVWEPQTEARASSELAQAVAPGVQWVALACTMVDRWEHSSWTETQLTARRYLRKDRAVGR